MSIKYLSQRDSRWSNVIYSAKVPHNETISSSGCGITSACMIVNSLTNNSISPPEMAKYSVENGFRIDGVGTVFSLFTAIAKKYGLKCTQTNNIEIAINCINNGGYCVCSTNGGTNGLFSSGGHLFCMSSINGDIIEFADPDNYSGKYNKSFRKNKAFVKGNFVYVSKENAKPEISTYFCFLNENKEIENIETIIKELNNRGIIKDKVLWDNKLTYDINCYWLARKAVNLTKNRNVLLNLTSINDIVWELKNRGIITDTQLWEEKLNADINCYWLANKICNMTELK